MEPSTSIFGAVAYRLFPDHVLLSYPRYNFPILRALHAITVIFTHPSEKLHKIKLRLKDLYWLIAGMITT